jgi:hypothetical protein
MKKVPCHYCGVDILEETARRTNGYCMPHAYNTSFSEIVQGEIEIVSRVTQQSVEKKLPHDYIKAFAVMKSLMLAGDELIQFKVNPIPEQNKFAKLGYAIFRDQKLITGIVVRWEANPLYDMDSSTEVSLEKISNAFGDKWEDIKNEIKEGDKFLFCETSPSTWACFAGRAFYAVKRGEEFIYTKVVMLN